MIKQIRNSVVGYVETIADKTGNIVAASVIVGIAVFIIVMIASIIPFIVGWALLAVIGIFTTVAVTGYWATAGIGLAVLILGNIFTN